MLSLKNLSTRTSDEKICANEEHEPGLNDTADVAEVQASNSGASSLNQIIGDERAREARHASASDGALSEDQEFSSDSTDMEASENAVCARVRRDGVGGVEWGEGGEGRGGDARFIPHPLMFLPGVQHVYEVVNLWFASK